MGTYLNPGSRAFQRALNSEIYVDKTGLLGYLNTVINTKQNYLCVSRPRRFGKTTALDMICAYYDRTQDAREIFAGLQIETHDSFEQQRNRYDVLKINMIDFLTGKKTVGEMLSGFEDTITWDLKRAYPDVDDPRLTSLHFIMNEIYQTHDRQFVIVIDEWDCIFRKWREDYAGQREYLDYLRNWLKDKEYVALAYMTGILPVKKYGEHSALNMFHEYSMTSQKQLAEYTGFTEDEVRALCERYQRGFDGMRDWYDGYLLRESLPVGPTTADGNVPKGWHIYAPLSVVNAVTLGIIENYWNETETYAALKVYIDMNFDGLRDTVIELLAGGRRVIDIRSYQNDMTTFESADDVLTLLVHIGYLGYDQMTKEVFIPNEEIREEYVSATRTGNWDEIIRAVSVSKRLLDDTIRKDAGAVAAQIENAHLETSHLQYNDENALSYTISLAYYSARQYYRVIREMPAGNGFADMIFLPRGRFAATYPAMIVELKWNDSPESAIAQIKEKKYPKALEGYSGQILIVGISYDKESRKHDCIIEEAAL